VANVLRRRGLIERAAPIQETPQPFERPACHQLWQCDHKGPLEIQRTKIHPFTILDDY
jgi:hypothetical protein